MWIPDFVKRMILNSIIERIKEEKNVIEFLQGKKTYIIMCVGIIVNGMFAMDVIDQKTLLMLDGIVVALGLGSLRAGISKIE